MPSPWKVSPAPSLSACTSFLNERSIAWSCARKGYIYNGSKAIATGEGGHGRHPATSSRAMLRPEIAAGSLHWPRLFSLGLGQTRREIRITKIGKRLLRRGAVEG